VLRRAARLCIVTAAALVVSRSRHPGQLCYSSAASGLPTPPGQTVSSTASAAVAARAARLGTPALALMAVGVQPVSAAFVNELPEATNYKEFKNSGLRPGNIGLDIRKLNRKGKTTAVPELKGCRNQENSCFSTLKENMIPGQKITWRLEPWRLPEGATQEQAIGDLATIIANYPPGQGGIDKGGFRIVEVKPDYIYAQFASVASLIDDVEFSPQKDGSVLVRSASRSPSDLLAPDGLFTAPDLGSNMLRLNYMAAELRKKGWTAPEITKEAYPFYFKVNGL